jgi:predicted nucleic acid-binding Zn ribbon protein
MQKHCLDCDEPMLGRADKKFCSDQCRNNYNNKRNSDVNNLMRNINNILRRNRRIMEELIPDEKVIVSRDKLNDLGFNFAYITHTYTTRKGAVYHFCYDYGYLEIGNDLFTLVYRKKGSQLSESA